MIDFSWSLTNHRLPDPKKKHETGVLGCATNTWGWSTGEKCDVPSLVCEGEQGFGENGRMVLNSELRGKKWKKIHT